MTPLVLKQHQVTLKVAVLVLIGALWAGVLWADYRDNYRVGLEALEAGRFDEAVRELRNAIAQRAEAKVGFRRYLPHFYLGLALHELGDCRGAITAWTKSEEQNEIKKVRDEYTDLRTRRKQCEDLLAELAAVQEQAQQDLEVARQSATKVISLSHQQALQSDWGSYAARQRAANEQLSQAETLVRNGQAEADRGKLAQARTLAAAATKSLDQLAGEARARLRELNEATAEALEQLGVVEGSASNVLESINDLKPFPPVLRRHARELQQIIDEAKAKEGSATTSELITLQDRLTVAMSQLRRAATRPPRALVGAVEAFLAGDFPKVLEVLRDAEYRDRRALAQRCLLRAGSRHALYVLEGEREARWLDEARTDIAACAQLDPHPEPMAKFYSPSFIDFYQITLQAIMAEEALPDEGHEGGADDEPSSSP